jgi:hypothetical protein
MIFGCQVFRRNITSQYSYSMSTVCLPLVKVVNYCTFRIVPLQTPAKLAGPMALEPGLVCRTQATAAKNSQSLVILGLMTPPWSTGIIVVISIIPHHHCLSFFSRIKFPLMLFADAALLCTERASERASQRAHARTDACNGRSRVPSGAPLNRDSKSG